MGVYLSHAVQHTHPEEGRVGKLRFAANAMQGWRMSMEDAHLMVVEDEYAAFGVFDGHGGREAAIFVASNLPAVLAQQREELLVGPGKLGDSAAVRLMLDRTFRATDQLMREDDGAAALLIYKADADKEPQAEDPEERAGKLVGCTGVMVYLCFKSQRIYCANAGDSRAVLCRGGETDALSEDHKPTDEIERNRIERNGGSVSADGRVCGNLNLSRAFADFHYKDIEKPEEEHLISVVPDFEVRDLQADDQFIVLGCDGIWELQTNEDVVENVKATLPMVGDLFEDIPPSEPELTPEQRKEREEDLQQQSTMLMLLGQPPPPVDAGFVAPVRKTPEEALGGHTVDHHGKEWEPIEGADQNEALGDAPEAGVRRRYMLSDCCAQVLRDSLSPGTAETQSKGCDNMTVAIVDIREWAKEVSGKR